MPLTKAINAAPVEYPIHYLLKKRWSPRSFSDESIEPELLNRLFEAARWAPSSYNEQPWRFIVARKKDSEAFENLSHVLGSFNRKWATDAPVLALGVTKKRFDRNGRPNPHAAHDLGQAIAHLTFEATKNELYVHQMAGFSAEQARETFDISDDFEPKTMFAIGYLGDTDNLKEQVDKSRSRKPLDDIVYEGNWEE